MKHLLLRVFSLSGIIVIAVAAFLYFKFAIPPKLSMSDIVIEDLSGKPVNVKQTYAGKPTVVNFWATWCGTCVGEMPDFEKIKQQYGQAINFVMISDESTSKITNFKKDHPYSFDFVKTNISTSKYGIHAIPTTYFYNAKGELSDKHTGGIDSKKLSKYIKSID